MRVFVAQPEWPITQLCVSVLHIDVCLTYKEQLDYMRSFHLLRVDTARHRRVCDLSLMPPYHNHSSKNCLNEYLQSK